MRTSTRTPRMSWFPCTPVDFLTDSDFLAMSAAAAGAYFKLMLYGWNAYTQGSGLSADPASLQRVTGMSSLEWDAVREQVLAHFKVRDDGTLYLPWQWDAAENATEKVRKLRESATAAAEAKSKIAQSKQIDEIDEIRLDKNGRPNGHQSSASPASVEQSGVSSPHDSPTSGRLVAPTSGVPLPHALKAPHESLDVEKIREHAVELGWKMPGVDHIQGLLAEGSVEDVCEAMDEYDGNLNGDDSSFAEYRFFAEGGGLTVMHVIANRGVHR